MKVNHLILTFAAAATLAACSSEMDIPTVADDTQTVTFTAQLPGGMGRSYGDGTTAKNLTYAVYDANGTLMSDLKGTATFEGLKAKVTLTLINNKEYNIVFWASADGSPYTFNEGNATVTADYTNTLCNDERLDAFTNTVNYTPSSDDDSTISVTLKRPFAQLNIGTNDMDDAKSAGLSDNATISVTVKNVCTTINLLTGVAGDTKDVTFGYGALPSDETFPITGYDYLAMNYLLVGKDSSTHDVSFQVSGISASMEYTEVPLKANYRTNLYGSLLGSTSSFNIEINPTFEE